MSAKDIQTPLDGPSSGAHPPAHPPVRPLGQDAAQRWREIRGAIAAGMPKNEPGRACSVANAMEKDGDDPDQIMRAVEVTARNPALGPAAIRRTYTKLASHEQLATAVAAVKSGEATQAARLQALVAGIWPSAQAWSPVTWEVWADELEQGGLQPEEIERGIRVLARGYPADRVRPLDHPPSVGQVHRAAVDYGGAGSRFARLKTLQQRIALAEDRVGFDVTLRDRLLDEDRRRAERGDDSLHERLVEAGWVEKGWME